MSTPKKELMDSELENISGGKFSYIKKNGTVHMQSNTAKKHAGEVYTFDAEYATDVEAYVACHKDHMSDDAMIDALLRGVEFEDGDGNCYTVKIK